jgi:hypothetical protein
MSARFLLAAACACALAGCKTPQPMLDQANNGAALSVSLQSQLVALRSAQANVAQSRLDSIRRQNAMIAEYEADSAFDDRIQAAAGKTTESPLAATLRALADSRAKDDADLKATLAALDASMAGLLDPVPAPDAKLAATQKAMAALGEEFQPEQRIKTIATFAVDLKKTIDSNNEKSKAAAANAPGAPVPAKPDAKPSP